MKIKNIVMVIGLLLVLNMLSLSVQAKEYQEYSVTLAQGIQGIVIEPHVEGQVPAVLLLHGFASQKDEVGDMYKRLGAALGNQGIASLRIDFRGWGESAGQMVESSIQGQVEDTAAAYQYLTQLKFVDPARIGVVGFSLGGGIAIVSAAQHPEWYTSMVVWSSVGDFHADFLTSLGQENFEKAEQDGQVTIDLGWREVTLGSEFFKSLKLYELTQEISKYPGAFLAIAGTEDFSIAYIDGYLAATQGSPKEEFVIEGADHIFGVLGEDQTTANRVIERTVQWFKETL